MNIKLQIPAAEITIAYEELSFKKIEEEILGLLKQIGRKLLEEFLIFVDDEEYRRRSGESGLESCGKKGSGKYIETVFGVIRYIRRRYHERGKAGGRYLADEKLGLGKREIASPGKQKAEIESAVDARSYRKSAAEKERWAGVKRSHESIRQLVVKEGQRIKEQREAQIREAEIAACYGDDSDKSDEPTHITRDIAYVEADSTYVPLQSRKHTRKGTGKRRSRKKRNLEIKLGIVYSGHEDRYAGGKGGQKRLQEKQVYVGVGDGGTFMKKFSVVCELTHMISAARRVIVGGDGARWIKEGMKDYFVNGVYVLCRYHLNRALKRALGYNKILEKQIRGLIKQDQIQRCIEKLNLVIQEAAILPKKQIQKLKELCIYLTENADGINAIERLKKEVNPSERRLIRHTGGIEGNVDKIIAQRMKGKGMSWSDRGAESLVQVMSKRTNGEWEQWWVSERDHKITINEADYRALETVSFWKESTPHSSVLSSVEMPALRGPHQDRPWVSVLRDVSGSECTVR